MCILVADDDSNTMQAQNAFNMNIMNQLIKNIYDELGIQFTAGCEHDKDFEGTWVSGDELSNPSPSILVQEFYQKYYGTKITSLAQIDKLNLKSFGWCVNKSVSAQCEALGTKYAEFNPSTAECKLLDAWYVDACENMLGGTWQGEICHIEDSAPEDTGDGDTPVVTDGNSGGSSKSGGSSAIPEAIEKFLEQQAVSVQDVREYQDVGKFQDVSQTGVLTTGSSSNVIEDYCKRFPNAPSCKSKSGGKSRF